MRVPSSHRAMLFRFNIIFILFRFKIISIKTGFELEKEMI